MVMVPPVANNGSAGRPAAMIIGVDDAGSRTPRRGGLALADRLIGALEIIVDHAALVDLKTDRIIWIVSLGLCRRCGIGRAERHKCQSQNAHQNLHGTIERNATFDIAFLVKVEYTGYRLAENQIFNSTGTSSGLTPDNDRPLTNHSRIWPTPRL